MNIQRLHISILPIVLCSMLLLYSCQSPVKTVTEVPNSILVVVQDQNARPISSVPVEAHEGAEPNATTLIESRVTDMNGSALFTFAIPTDGGVYSIVAGNTQTGRIIRTADLLCRDTTIFITLQGMTLNCNGALADSVIFVDACAAFNGTEFTETAERRYTSQCDESMTVNFTPLVLDNVRLQVQIFDNSGSEVQGNSFVLPALGSFSVIISYTPLAEGILDEAMVFSAQGSVSNWTLDLAIRGNATNCSNCNCNDEVIVIDMGEVVGIGDSSAVVRQDININRTICPRIDELIQNFTNPRPFRLENTPSTSVSPGASQTVQIRFSPSNIGDYTDSLVFSTTYTGSGAVCRFTVIVTGRSVRPSCCIDEQLSEGLVIDRSTNPPTYRIEIQTTVQNTGSGTICYYNCGSGGWLTVSRPEVQNIPGFNIPEQRYSLPARTAGGGTGCFEVFFTPSEQMVWPNGRNNGPAVTVFTTNFTVFGCEPSNVEVIARIDTTPTLFSICVFRWDQNKLNGYNFTPAELRGSFVEDFNADDLTSPMLTDFAYLSGPGTTLSGRVRIQSGYKLIRTGVNDQADFSYSLVRAWPEFPAFTQGLNTTVPLFEMELFAVYVIRIIRNGVEFFALVRVREISDDGQKQKLCLDVLFPL
jgi:hypothetical protein